MSAMPTITIHFLGMVSEKRGQRAYGAPRNMDIFVGIFSFLSAYHACN